MPFSRQGATQGVSQAVPADWVPSGDVLCCVYAGNTFLLSLRTGAYHVLDETAGLIWRQLCAGDSLPAIARHIANEYGGSVSEETASADINELFRDLVARGVVNVGDSSRHRSSIALAEQVFGARDVTFESNASPARLPSVVECMGRLLIVHLVLKTAGLSRMLRYLHRVKSRRLLRRLSEDTMTELSGRVGRASVLYPFGAACLERSVCLLWITRRVGGDAVLKLGVQPFPFAAHAWVEHNGVPVNGSAEHVGMFKPLELIAPRPRR